MVLQWNKKILLLHLFTNFHNKNDVWKQWCLLLILQVLRFFFPSVIARRRIQHSTEAIGSLIDQCDLVELPPEHAELLLKFVPTKEEVSTKYDTVPQRERFFSSFYKDQLANIHRHCWKQCLKTRKISKLKVIRWKRANMLLHRVAKLYRLAHAFLPCESARSQFFGIFPNLHRKACSVC